MGGQYGTIMSNQRYFRIICFRFPTDNQKNISFLKQNLLSFGSKNFFIQKQLNCLVSKFFLDYKKFCFVLEISELNQNIFVLFLYFSKIFGRNRNVPHLVYKQYWNTSKRFGFVWILSFDIKSFVLSFRFC
jgi:hypothetical protein